MLSKNSTFVMFAVLLLANSSIIFSNVDEEATTLTTVKEAVRTVAIKAQALEQQDVAEEVEVAEEVVTEVVAE